MDLMSLPGVRPSNAAALGISGNGTRYVGWAENGSGVRIPVRWGPSAATPTPIGGSEGHANAASTDGSILVGRLGMVTGEAFVWEEGQTQVTPLGTLTSPAPWSEALDVSGDGSVIVGRSQEGADTTGAAVIWESSGTPKTLLSAMRERGFEDPLTGTALRRATAISKDATVVVGCATTTSGTRGFRVRLDP